MKAIIHMTHTNIWKNAYLWLLALSVLAVISLELLPLLTAKVIPLHVKMCDLACLDVNFCVACMGATLLFLLMFKPKNWELAAILVPGLVLEAVCRMCRPESPSMRWTHMWQFGSGLFPFALLFGAWKVYRLGKSGQRDSFIGGLEILGLGLCMPVLYAFSGGVIGLRGERYVYDGRLLGSDYALFGFHPTFGICSFLRHNIACDILMNFTYDFLAMWLLLSQVLVYMQGKIRPNGKLVRFFPALTFVVVYYLGLHGYFYLPAVGTQAFCGSAVFPDGIAPDPLSVLNPVAAPALLPRNCMPSLHLTWIMCAAVSVCNFGRKYLYIGVSLVALTLLSAISVGCHWISDFLVALPFTVLCLALTCLALPWLTRLVAIVWGAGASWGLMVAIKNYPTMLLSCHGEYASIGAVVIAVSLWLIVLIARNPDASQSSEEPGEQAACG